MTHRFIFEGIYTPIITPLLPDGSFNFDALADQIDHLVEAGVHGIISGGSTGEYYAQTVEERLDLARFTRERIAGRVPLVVGVGAMRRPDAIALATAAREMRAEAILLGSPPYALPTERENAENALAIDRAADLPVMLYNYPGRMGVNMGTEFLDLVSQSPNFCAIKESSGDINRLHQMAQEYPSIQLSCGMDDQALEFFAWGARSWVCAGSNLLPREHVALYRACLVEGDFARGRRIMAAMMPLMRVLEQGGKFVQCVKHGTTLAGIDAGGVLPPLQPLEEAEAEALEAVVATVRTTIAGINGEG